MNMNNIINHAKEDEEDLFLRLHLDVKKMHYILMQCRTFPLEDIKDKEIIGVVISAPNDLAEFVIEKNEPLFIQQTFSELFIMAGISFFERYCKEWFAWGLKYSPTRLNFFGNKSIDILEITNSNDVKQTIINKIVDDINFQDIEICNKKFNDVYGFKMFSNIKDIHKFKKILNHRHIISHNCGCIDTIYTKKMGMSDKFVGSPILIKDEQLEEFLNLLMECIYRLYENIPPKIYNDLENDIKKD